MEREIWVTDFTIRDAVESDVPALVALINCAYRVEDFFKSADRTDPADVRSLMNRGRFLLLEDNRNLAGSVFVQVDGARGYFSMLSIDPARQNQGLGARLVVAAEDTCRRSGCTEMELQVVSLRIELLEYYRSFGYDEYGTRPFPEPQHLTQPCHCILMRKDLHARITQHR